MKLIILLIFFLFLAPVVSFFLIQIYQMPDSNMEPTLEPNQYLVFKKYVLTVANPKRGDIVLYRDPKSKAASVGRVIILPSEKFTVSEGSIYIDQEESQRLDEPYLKPGVKNRVEIEGIWFETGKAQYIILPDNRGNILNPKNSTVEQNNIIGTLLIAFWYPTKCFMVSYCP